MGQLSLEQIEFLRGSAHDNIDRAIHDLNYAMKSWEAAIGRFTGAFITAYENYKNAIQQSERLRKWIFDLCFAAVTPMCGYALGWMKAALIADSEAYQKFCTHFFGIVLGKWTGDLAKHTLQKLSHEAVQFTMPALLSQTSPNAFKHKIDDVFKTNCLMTSKKLNDLLQLFGGYEGTDIITKHLKNKSYPEALSAISWEYHSQLRHFVLGSSYYYNHKPDIMNFPSQEIIELHIERSMWAETFKGNNPLPPKWVKAAATSLSPAYYEAVKFIYYKPGSPVEARLKELGIMADAKEKKPGTLKDFGSYTSDEDLKQLIQWAHDFQPEVIGGLFPPQWRTPPMAMSNYRKWQLRTVC